MLTNDPDREVRDHAFKVIKGFLSKLERVSDDPSLRESMGMRKFLVSFSHSTRFHLKNCIEIEADVNRSAGSSLTDSASTWTGWAVNAVTSKFYKSQGNQIDQTSVQRQDSSTLDTANPGDALPTTDGFRKQLVTESGADSPLGNMNVSKSTCC